MHRGPYAEISDAYRVLRAEMANQGIVDPQRCDHEGYHYLVLLESDRNVTQVVVEL